MIQVFFQLKFGKMIGRLRRQTAVKIDERINSLRECVNGIETVKCYTWERVFLCILTNLRNDEHKTIFKSQIIKGSNL